MKSFIYFFTFITLSFASLAQDNIEKQKQAIIEEGSLLHNLTIADKIASELFAKQFKGKDKNYLNVSYRAGDLTTYVFYTSGDKPKAIGSVTMDRSMDKETAKVLVADRDLSLAEKDLVILKKSATQLVASDPLFESVKGNAILIPLVYKGAKKVYVLPKQQNEGVVVFGNDFLINYDNSNNLLDKKKIHPDAKNVNYRASNEKEGEPMKEMHNHYPESGEILNVTDVYLLMKYSKAANWKQHSVISESYISIWNCDANEMITIPKGSRTPKE